MLKNKLLKQIKTKGAMYESELHKLFCETEDLKSAANINITLYDLVRKGKIDLTFDKDMNKVFTSLNRNLN